MYPEKRNIQESKVVEEKENKIHNINLSSDVISSQHKKRLSPRASDVISSQHKKRLSPRDAIYRLRGLLSSVEDEKQSKPTGTKIIMKEHNDDDDCGGDLVKEKLNRVWKLIDAASSVN